jgi:hypothetical protein
MSHLVSERPENKCQAGSLEEFLGIQPFRAGLHTMVDPSVRLCGFGKTLGRDGQKATGSPGAGGLPQEGEQAHIPQSRPILSLRSGVGSGGTEGRAHLTRCGGRVCHKVAFIGPQEGAAAQGGHKLLVAAV